MWKERMKTSVGMIGFSIWVKSRNNYRIFSAVLWLHESRRRPFDSVPGHNISHEGTNELNPNGVILPVDILSGSSKFLFVQPAAGRGRSRRCGRRVLIRLPSAL